VSLVCASSFEEFKRLFDKLLKLKIEEQRKRELRLETTTCANRWEAQTYEVDEQVCDASHSWSVLLYAYRRCSIGKQPACSELTLHLADRR
jgi:hypothetical protein